MRIHRSLILLLLGMLVLVQQAYAATYKYIDKAGGICFADDLQSIPEQYRPQAALIEGELREKPVRSAVTPTAATAAPTTPALIPVPRYVPPVRQEPLRWSLPLSVRLAITFAVGICLIVAGNRLGKLRMFSEDRLARISLRSAVLALFLVYLAVAHGRDTLTIARATDRAVDEMQAQSFEKGKKFGDGIKKLDALFEEMQKAEDAAKKEEEQPAPERP